MALDKAPANFTVNFNLLCNTPLGARPELPNMTVIPLPTGPIEGKKYEEESRYGKEWVNYLRGKDKYNFMSLRVQATPLNRIKRFFGIKLNTQEIMKMADQVYHELPDKFQVENDIIKTKQRKSEGTKRDGSFSYMAGSFPVPLGQERLFSSEYTPLRGACILMRLSEAGLVPEYDKLNSLTELQKRTFLMRIAQNQKIMAEMLLKNKDEIKHEYGDVLLQEATKMFETALQTSSGNLEK